jgi:hypothetical protein
LVKSPGLKLFTECSIRPHIAFETNVVALSVTTTVAAIPTSWMTVWLSATESGSASRPLSPASTVSKISVSWHVNFVTPA